MAIVATTAVSTLEQINSMNLRAVFGGSLLLLCCLIAANLFKKNSQAKYYIFLTLISVIGLTSGILLASAVYVTQNPNIYVFWDIQL